MVDQVVVENGVRPDEAIYYGLKEGSRNKGQIDVEALFAIKPQPCLSEAGDGYLLFRIGDRLAQLTPQLCSLQSGVGYIAQVLKRNRTLRVCNLAENKIDVAGLVSLAEALVSPSPGRDLFALDHLGR